MPVAPCSTLLPANLLRRRIHERHVVVRAVPVTPPVLCWWTPRCERTGRGRSASSRVQRMPERIRPLARGALCAYSPPRRWPTWPQRPGRLDRARGSVACKHVSCSRDGAVEWRRVASCRLASCTHCAICRPPLPPLLTLQRLLCSRECGGSPRPQ